MEAPMRMAEGGAAPAKVTAEKSSQRRLNWSVSTTESLIRLWEDNLAALWSNTRNARIYDEMTRSLNARLPAGEVPFTAKPLRQKLENLNKQYRFDMIKYVDGKMDRGISGRAYIAAVCLGNGIGEGEDTAPTYSGVNTLAHELAHSLGSPHDETPECPWAEGYLMSYVDGGLKKYKLSRCSQQKIRQNAK
ncbi:hypothetical protein HPB49_011210 [Dermacentor silvarum]|uniref:Uncharacterized protein n=1 Tax=Dermacentor silvarum TaxID=543639 RepID=A0ACB8C359_DERSI|nr:hypothetical protein HPB49_011210 [Dermacentor silvarum]